MRSPARALARQPAAQRISSPSPSLPTRREAASSRAPEGKESPCPEDSQQEKEPESGAEKAYFGASVVDGVPRADKRQTWRAEIYLPRAGAPPAHRDRGSVCIRGPNRFGVEEAEDDLEQFKWTAEQAGAEAAKQVRGLASRLKTEFERKKHLDSGHAMKED